MDLDEPIVANVEQRAEAVAVGQHGAYRLVLDVGHQLELQARGLVAACLELAQQRVAAGKDDRHRVGRPGGGKVPLCPGDQVEPSRTAGLLVGLDEGEAVVQHQESSNLAILSAGPHECLEPVTAELAQPPLDAAWMELPAVRT